MPYPSPSLICLGGGIWHNVKLDWPLWSGPWINFNFALFFFVSWICCFTSEVMSGRSIIITTLFWAGLPEAFYQYIVYILLPLTDNCSSSISGRGKMTVALCQDKFFTEKSHTLGCGFAVTYSNIWVHTNTTPTLREEPVNFFCFV